MSDKILRAYSVIDKGEGKDPFWHNIGTAFPNKDGKGFNIILEVLPLPVDGKIKITVREVEPKEAEAEDAPKKTSHSRK